MVLHFEVQEIVFHGGDLATVVLRQKNPFDRTNVRLLITDELVLGMTHAQAD